MPLRVHYPAAFVPILAMRFLFAVANSILNGWMITFKLRELLGESKIGVIGCFVL